MPISQEEFDRLQAGDDVRVISCKYSQTTCSAGRVIARTKTGVKVKLLAANFDVIFTSPTRYRGQGTWDATRQLATAEDWQASQVESHQRKIRREARMIANELDKLSWSHISRKDAMEKCLALREKIAEFDE